MKKLLFILFLFSKAHGQTNVFVAPSGGNDGPALASALQPNTVVHFAFGTYNTDRTLYVPANCTIEGNGAILKATGSLVSANAPVITNKAATILHNTSASIAITAGNLSFSYAGYNTPIGSIVRLLGPGYAMYPDAAHGYSNGMYDIVNSKSGNTHFVSQLSPRSYTATSITIYQPTTNVHVIGLHLNMKGRTAGQGIVLKNVSNSSVEDVFVECDSNTANGIDQGITATGVNILLLRDTVKNIKPKTPGGASGVAYGINLNGSNITVQSCYCRNIQTCITAGGDRGFFSQGIQYLDADVDCQQGNGHALDAHGNAYRFKIDGGTVKAGPNGAGPIAIRASYDTIRNLSVTIRNTGVDMRAIYAFENVTTNVLIENNSFVFTGTGGNSYVFQNSKKQLAPLSNFTFRNNYVKGGVLVLAGSLGANISVTNNRFETAGIFPANIYMTATSVASYLIQGNSFVNRFGNTSGNTNYAINTSKAAASHGIIKNDTVYIMDAANLFVQFKINNTTDSVYNNVIYSPNNYFIKDFTNTSANYYANNTRINGIGAPTVFNPDTGGGTTDPFEPPPVIEPPIVDEGSGKVCWMVKQ